MTDRTILETPNFFAVDFFCGAGGTTRGLIDAGGYVLAGVDKDDNCKSVYEDNNINDTHDGQAVKYLHRDIFDKTEDYPDGEKQELRAELHEMIGEARKAAPGVPLMFSVCAPCQPFTRISQEGTLKGKKEKREKDKNLLSETATLIDEFEPEIIMCENVAGIQDKKYGGVWQDFVAKLQEKYVVGSRVVDAQKYGIPQRRRRSIAIAVHKDYVVSERLVEEACVRSTIEEGHQTQSFMQVGSEMVIELPENDPHSPIVTVKDAIGDLEKFPPIKCGETHAEKPNHAAANLTDINKRRLQALEPGGNNRDFPEDLRLNCHKKVQSRVKADGTKIPGGFSDVYTRMDPNRPAPTITTKCFSISNGRYGHWDKSQVRAISPREAAALQTFPVDYKFPERIGDAARMIGNAVPPKLAKFFAGVAMDHFDHERLQDERAAA